MVQPSPFSEMQQKQSKYDGQLELDGTSWRLVPLQAGDVDGNVAKEIEVASAEERPLRSHMDIPLTNCLNSVLPHYRLLGSFGRVSRAPDGRWCVNMESQLSFPSKQPIVKSEETGLWCLAMPCGSIAGAEQLLEDADNFEHCFAHDVRRSQATCFLRVCAVQGRKIVLIDSTIQHEGCTDLLLV